MICRSSRDDKVFSIIDASNAVKACDERFSGSLVNAGDDGRDVEGAETPLVEVRRDQVRHGFRLNVPFFTESVHIYFCAEIVGAIRRVGGSGGLIVSAVSLGGISGMGNAYTVSISVAKPVSPR